MVCQVRWITGEVPDDNVGINERCHASRPLRATRAALALRAVRRTSSQLAPRRAAGTLTEPSSSNRSGVRARVALWPSTRNATWSPSSIPSASRTCFGIVTCPLLVTVAVTSTAVTSTIHSLPRSKSKDTLDCGGSVPTARTCGGWRGITGRLVWHASGAKTLGLDEAQDSPRCQLGLVTKDP